MPTIAWALIFSFTTNGPVTVIDKIASEKSRQALKEQVAAPKATCVHYEMALEPRYG
jgi:hypothetical protein